MAIKSFTGLVVWQKAHKLVLESYRLTDSFPSKERFGLTSQLRRAAVSITSNISEGFERKSSRELIQFLAVSRGSLAEVQNQLLIARDLNYISRIDFDKIASQTVEVHKLLNAFTRSIKTKDQRLETSN